MSYSKNKIKLSSFGIIEAIIASFIIVLMVSGAVALSSASLRTALLGGSYLEAEHIADSVMEQIVASKSAGKLYFDSSPRTPVQLESVFSIDCFDSAKRNKSGCLVRGAFRPEVPYVLTTEFDADNFVKTKSKDISPSYPDDYFSWRLKINPSNSQNCKLVDDIAIPLEKCRFAEIEVKWTESTGVKHYYLSQYFTDWNNQ